MVDAWIVKGIDNTISICIGANRRRLVAGGWLSFNRVGNAVVVAVEVEIVRNPIAIGVDWRCAQLIPSSVAIGIGKAGGVCLGNRNGSVLIGVSRDREDIAAFDQIADSIVVAVEVTFVVYSIAIGIRHSNADNQSVVVVEVWRVGRYNLNRCRWSNGFPNQPTGVVSVSRRSRID